MDTPTPKKADFGAAWDFVWDIEKGETTDTGGYTKHGISTNAHPDEDIKNMTPARAKAICRAEYWNALNLDELPQAIALPMVDVAFNAGQAKAVRCLQRAVNQISGHDLKVDGVLGPITRGAVLAMTRANPSSAVVLGILVALGRLEIHYKLAGYKKYEGNIRGWAGRCVKLCKETIKQGNKWESDP